VAAAIRSGREYEPEIGVRCGGHSVLGLAVPEDGLMIDLTPMGGVRVDPQRRRAWVRGGALLGAVDQATQEHGGSACSRCDTELRRGLDVPKIPIATVVDAKLEALERNREGIPVGRVKFLRVAAAHPHGSPTGSPRDR
jgi:hypothetical protein